VGLAGYEPLSLARYFIDSLNEDLNILTVHTELEGKRWGGFLKDFIRLTIDQGFTYTRLMDIAQMLRDNSDIPRCTIFYGYVEGRAGEVSCQKLAN